MSKEVELADSPSTSMGADLYVAGWNRADDDGGGGAAPWGTPTPVFVELLGAVAANTVYHVVLVMNGDAAGTTGTITGYLNGVSFGQQAGVDRLWDHNPIARVAKQTVAKFRWATHRSQFNISQTR